MSDPYESEVVTQERAACVEASRDGCDDMRFVGGSWFDETSIPDRWEIE